MKTIQIIPLVVRGASLKCGTCPAETTIEKKNTLPAGWLLLNERQQSGETLARPVCPECDAREVERWNP